MEKICQYCKSYCNGKCINKDFKNSVSATSCIDDKANDLFEEGYVSEYLREHVDTDGVIAIVIDMLKEGDYIKKNRKEIEYNKLDDYDGLENELVEMCDDVLSGLVLPRIKNVNINLEVESEFSCKYWE